MGINIQAKTDYSSLFSSLNESTSADTGVGSLTSLLTDYSSIKSGTYSKLMKAYYSEDSSDEVSKVASDSTVSTVSDDTKTYNKIASNADALNTSLSSLGKLSSDTDSDELYSAVNSYVKDYNALLSSVDSADDTSISNRLTTLKGYTSDNSSELAGLGITIGSDGALSLDKDTFMAADKSAVDTLFASKNSYAYSVSASASMIQSSATYNASKSSTYTNSGDYTSVVGSLWDTTT